MNFVKNEIEKPFYDFFIRIHYLYLLITLLNSIIYAKL